MYNFQIEVENESFSIKRTYPEACRVCFAHNNYQFSTICFYTLHEMEETAKAMLKYAKKKRKQNDKD